MSLFVMCFDGNRVYTEALTDGLRIPRTVLVILYSIKHNICFTSLFQCLLNFGVDLDIYCVQI
jgi:hypothetical protein